METSMVCHSGDLTQWRKTHYNAVVTDVIEVHAELRILRVRADAGRFKFKPGQFAVLGLAAFEPCAESMDREESLDPDKQLLATTTPSEREPIIRRAYSIAGSLLDGQGRLVRSTDCDYLEFYVALVRGNARHVPGLTPRLFRLLPGDRLYLGPRAGGSYTLAPLTPTEAIVFAATGTGEAPHNAMVAELLAAGHRGPITSVSCVRLRRDLAYLSAHRELERRHPQYRYLSLTTREPENLEASSPGFVGRRYLQEYFASGDFERDRGISLDPQRTHVYLCGSPVMVGLPDRTSIGLVYPKPKGMVEVLADRGFVLDGSLGGFKRDAFVQGPAEGRGNIHCERYW
jgi:ferredoxin--NADP+ reductase